ncbi:MAG: response regulator transcription factor [Verrucomicrobiales bacterium]|nr:response regulator transcription factor [Verrucomicrobiales bacterium]
MSDATTVILADDHPMFRFGLKSAIGLDEGFLIVGEADDGLAALALIEERRPGIAVVDWEMPGLNGLELLRQVTQRGLPTRVIILTMYNEEGLFGEALDAGVFGFVLKDNAVSDILACLRMVRDGEIYLSPAVSRSLLKRTRRAAELRREKPGLDALSPTERRVLLQVAEGRTTREIAVEVGVSPHTIETHRRNIARKLDLQGSHSLLQFALLHRGRL